MPRRLLATGQLHGTDQRTLVTLGKKLKECFSDIEVSPPNADRKTIGLIVYYKIYSTENKRQQKIGA